MGIKLSINGLTKVKSKLNQLAKYPNYLPWEQIGRYLVSETHLRFLTSRGPDGKKWHPTKRGGQILGDHNDRPRSFLTWHPTKRGRQILVDRGHLRNSITYNIKTKTALEIGSNLIYAAIHQLGGRTGKNHNTVIIARPYLGINNNEQQEIIDIITDAWQTLVRK